MNYKIFPGDARKHISFCAMDNWHMSNTADQQQQRSHFRTMFMETADAEIRYGWLYVSWVSEEVFVWCCSMNLAVNYNSAISLFNPDVSIMLCVNKQ